jgi:hypothetical protein
MRAMAPDVTARYQRAPELLADLMAARAAAQPRRTPGGNVAKAESGGGRSVKDDAHGIQTRLRARDTPAARFCWQCRKPLHARTDKCPFCGETQ